jgi:23S rRNA (cytosine1962-C5)-methyltransferase
MSAAPIPGARVKRLATETATLAPAADRPAINLLPGRHKRARAGHPWVYSNEIAMDNTAKKLAPGTLVRLAAATGEPLGVAMFNPHTLIAARILDRDPASAIDVAFFRRRLAGAGRLRERLYPGGFYRLIHAEADGLPGLVIDRYGEAVAVQANTAGMDRLLPELLAALDEEVAPKIVVLRNDSPARGLETLPSEVKLAKGALAGPLEVIENGCRFLVDLEGGQKTGWFFDQRDNRAAVARLASGGTVLDLYTYGGGFAIAAARAGASQVTAIDRSAPALALAEDSARRNGVDATCRFSRGEAFAELERRSGAGEHFDVVIADPPAFVKSRKDLAAGLRGYRKLVRLAASVVAPGGVLFIASCSHNVERAMFDDEVRRGLADAGRAGRILLASGAAADHPVHPALPESVYLKASLLQLD